MHQESQSQQQAGQTPEPIDILSNHRARNRANRPPDEDRLRVAAAAQIQATSPASDDETSSEVDSESGSESGVHSQMRHRAKRNSKTTGEAKPTTLRYYDGTWRAALETSKLSFLRFILLRNAFPTREEHLDDAHEVLAETVSLFQSRNRIFDPSNFSLFTIHDI